MASADELVDVVDESGTVIATVTRAEMRSQNLLHRSVESMDFINKQHIMLIQIGDNGGQIPGSFNCGAGAAFEAT